MQCEVTPSELTLAISIPTDREEFEKQLLQTDRYDYVASIARRYPGVSREGLWNLLAPTVRACNYVAREAESLGALVLKGFKSSQFEEVLVGKRVTTIVAHWRVLPLTADDILDSRQIISEINTKNDPVCEVLRRFIADENSICSRSEPASLLAAAMNKCMRSENADNGMDLTAHVADSSYASRLTRADIDERFPLSILPSRDIELADGLSTVGQFISAIPADFNGVMDLTICNSVILGSAIKRMRPEITVVMNQRAASARNRLVLYLAIVKELQRQPQLFGDAAVNVRNIVRGIRT